MIEQPGIGTEVYRILARDGIMLRDELVAKVSAAANATHDDVIDSIDLLSIERRLSILGAHAGGDVVFLIGRPIRGHYAIGPDDLILGVLRQAPDSAESVARVIGAKCRTEFREIQKSAEN